jgi:hypothetical protein
MIPVSKSIFRALPDITEPLFIPAPRYQSMIFTTPSPAVLGTVTAAAPDMCVLQEEKPAQRSAALRTPQSIGTAETDRANGFFIHTSIPKTKIYFKWGKRALALFFRFSYTAGKSQQEVVYV